MAAASTVRHETRALLRAHLAAASVYRHLTRQCAVCHRLLALALEAGDEWNDEQQSPPVEAVRSGESPDRSATSPDRSAASPGRTQEAPTAQKAGQEATPQSAPEAASSEARGGAEQPPPAV
ncbi:DUF6274 family protein [Streptomyces sp. NPDC046887]|uniref:DUF6274 family protein n=1 Tax=Streptomyces sp. NPDC046887 TaxID=3155472 RepID=UPI0033FB4241